MAHKFLIISAALLFVAIEPAAASEQPSPEEDAAAEKKFYKKIGPDGQIIYTDKPTKDSKEIKVPKGTTYSPVTTPRLTPHKTRQKPKPFAYENLLIVRPAQEETIWSNEGKLDVAIKLTPTLRDNHKIAISVDGNRLIEGQSLTASLSGIDPGEHVLKAEILNAAGSTFLSESVTFYMKRHIIKN